MAKSNVWLSVSDLMTGLMIVFLFIAIAYMSRVEQNQIVLTDYVETKKELHAKLVKEFAGDTLRWQMSIGQDLSMKFNNPTVLFEVGKINLTLAFEQILNEFLPRYFDILLNDELRKNIKEIRIEGHTDDSPITRLGYDPDPYLGNVKLSQERALSVLKYLRSMPSYQNYSKEERKLLEYWFTANGLSFGHSLDSDGELTFKSGEPINKQLSRRVEFRIVTTGDEILENFVNKNK